MMSSLPMWCWAGESSVDDACVQAIVRETMRYCGPIRRLYRRVTEDITVNAAGDVAGSTAAAVHAGQEWVTFKAGDFVQFVTTDANRDPAVFPNPAAFSWRRYAVL